jgi:Nucleotidyltransferase of unknown function (DUF6036)
VSNAAVAELLRVLAGVMKSQGLSWFLFGAQAAILWGSSRFTGDVDVTVAIPDDALEDFIEAMAEHEFALKFPDRDFIQRSRVLPFIHRPTNMALDVVRAGPGLEEEFAQRTISVELQQTSVPVISPEDLIVMKVLAGRPKDIDDIRGVIHEHRETLDVERIRTLLRFLEQALTQSDLLPEFERVWQSR